MGKGIILYQSKYGATKKYAEWLREVMKFDCIKTKHAAPALLREYDTIVLGGGVYASGIAGLRFLKKNIVSLDKKRLAVFAVGASPYDEKAVKQLRETNFKGSLSEIPFFYCRGAWNEDAMSFGDRALCRMLQKAVAKQDPKSLEPWQQALLGAAGQECDWTDREYLKPLIDYLS